MQYFTTVKMKWVLAVVCIYIFFYNPYLTTKFAIHERVVIQKSCKKPRPKIEKICSIVRIKILISHRLLSMGIDVCRAGTLIVRFSFKSY